MTALDLLAALDTRPARPSAPAGRGGAPGAAAFADAVRDAERETAPAGPESSERPAADTATGSDGPAAGAPADGSTGPAPLPLPTPSPPAAATPPPAIPPATPQESRTPTDRPPAAEPLPPTASVLTDSVGTVTDAPPAPVLSAASVPETPLADAAAAATPDEAATDDAASDDAGAAPAPLLTSSALPSAAPQPVDAGGAAPHTSSAIDAAALGARPERAGGASAGSEGRPSGLTTSATDGPEVTPASVPLAEQTIVAGAASVPATPSTPAPVAAPPAAGIDPVAAGSAAAPNPVAAAAPAPVAPPSAVPAPVRPALLPQVAAPVLSLAQAPDGDHRITLTVSPENLGPVTVRAHIAGSTLRIELQAPNEIGRDALRALLVDLRRDLAVAAPHATLSLSTGDGSSASPQHGSTTHGQTGNGSPDTPRPPTTPRPPAAPPAPTPPAPPPAPPAGPSGGIDVYA